MSDKCDEWDFDRARKPILPLSAKAFWCQNNPREAADEIAALLTENTSLRERAERAEKTMYRWRSAFQEVTPGGSEFMDPESVRAYMQQMKHETVEAKKDAALSRKQLVSLRSLNESAAEVIRAMFEAYEGVCDMHGKAQHGGPYQSDEAKRAEQLASEWLRLAASWSEKHLGKP